MCSKSTLPIPPPGERGDYICKLDHTKPGLWILKRDEHMEAFQTSISSGLTDEEAMEKAGGIFYATADPSVSRPFKELLAAADAAYLLLEEDPAKFMEALKTSAIEKHVWMFILNTDPWYRPRGAGVGELLLRDTDGPGVWVIKGTREAQLNIQNNRALGLDDEVLIRESGGIYYTTIDDLPAERNPDLPGFIAADQRQSEEYTGVAIVIKRSAEFPDDHFIVHCSMEAIIDFKYSVNHKMWDPRGEREEPFLFNPKTKSKVVPKVLQLGALADYVDSGEFTKLAVLHVYQSREPEKFYGK